MQTAVAHRYGSPEVVRVQTAPNPTIGKDDVLIKVKAAALTSADARVRRADPFFVRFMYGLIKPRKKVFGSTFAGVVEAVGENVRSFKKGDKVFGTTDTKLGTHAEYIALPHDKLLLHMPSNLDFEQAAAIPFGFSTALHFLRKGGIQKGQRVLINGAAGALGSAAVQLAKHFGTHVTAVCGSDSSKLVKSIGADSVINYSKEPADEWEKSYDLIFDTVGKLPLSIVPKLLNEHGRYVSSVHMSPVRIFEGLVRSFGNSKKISGGVSTEKREDLELLADLCQKEIIKPVVSKTFPLEKVANAHRYVDSGHKQGNVVIRMS